MKNLLILTDFVDGLIHIYFACQIALAYDKFAICRCRKGQFAKLSYEKRIYIHLIRIRNIVRAILVVALSDILLFASLLTPIEGDIL